MIIELKDVMFSYPDKPAEPVLAIPHWFVKKKESVLIHGPSGCGKSTLLNVVSGMLAPVAGTVSVLGHQLDKMSEKQRDKFRARHIGYVFQQFNLIPYLDAVDNVRLASHFGRINHSSASRDDIEKLLGGLDLPPDSWHKKIAQLSVGQQQRVAIARALINKPEVVIADEPTSALDEYNRNRFMGLLMAYTAEVDTALVFVSHDITLSTYFNRVDAWFDMSATGS